MMFIIENKCPRRKDNNVSKDYPRHVHEDLQVIDADRLKWGLDVTLGLAGPAGGASDGVISGAHDLCSCD